MSATGNDPTGELEQGHGRVADDRRTSDRRTNRRGVLKAALGVAAATVGAAATLETGTGTARADGTEGPTTFSSTTGTAVTAHSGSGYAVVGISDSFTALYGATGSTASQATAILGVVIPTSPGSYSAAVRGQNNGTGGLGIGVWGSQGGSGWGVYGTSPKGVGLYGQSDNGWAGYFQGNVNVTGTLSKGGGSFKIDHPLDPANRYLSHSFVESPDMLNIYNGVAMLDAHGKAVVELPAWFEALNRDYRYQLTAIGGPGPNLHVAEEVHGGHFTIAGGTPRTKVSWQVTGIRKDAWANAHRIEVEEYKPTAERGFYLHPELYGEPAEKGIGEAAQSRQRVR